MKAIFINRTLDRYKESDIKKVQDFLKAQQQQIVDQNPDDVFHTNLIDVEIQSADVVDSFDLLDLPGIIALDSSADDTSGAAQQIADIVKDICKEYRNPIYSLVHDSRIQLDNDIGLETLIKLGVKKCDINVVYTRVDGIIHDPEERELLFKFIEKNKNIYSNIYLLSNKSQEDPQLYSDDDEDAYWKNLADELSLDQSFLAKCGIKQLRKCIVLEITKIFMDKGLIDMKKILLKHVNCLEDLLQEKKKLIEELQRDPHDTIEEIKKDLDFIYKQHDTNCGDDPDLKKYKRSIKKTYTSDLLDVQKKIKESLERDFHKESAGQLSTVEKYMFDNQENCTAVRADGENYNELFRLACEHWVGRIEDFTAVLVAYVEHRKHTAYKRLHHPTLENSYVTTTVLRPEKT